MTPLRFVEKLPSGIRPRVFTEDIVTELRDRPGTWALVRTYLNSKDTRGPRRINRPDDIEIRVFSFEDPRRIEVYARAVPAR